VAQHKIQQFLKYYQERRKITILLTSHYMKDVAALCKRVVIIAGGLIKYDGSLSGIVDSFGEHKVVTLQLADERRANGFERFGQVLDAQPPRVKLRIDRSQVARVLAAILAEHVIDDVAVEDPPLEEVIAQVFSQVNEGQGSRPRG
jgi:ABC-2 type transport system ATP-binding protein